MLRTQLCSWWFRDTSLNWRFNLHFPEFKGRAFLRVFLVHNEKPEQHLGIQH